MFLFKLVKIKEMCIMFSQKSKMKKNLLIAISAATLVCSIGSFGYINAHAADDDTAKTYEDREPVKWSLGGTLKKSYTEAVLKFSNQKHEPTIGGIITTNLDVTMKFAQNPYEIRYFKGLTDDEVTTKPSSGYPTNTKALYDTNVTLRSYYEDNKERLGRSYGVYFDSNDAKDSNGSTYSTVVKVSDETNSTTMNDKNRGQKHFVFSYPSQSVTVHPTIDAASNTDFNQVLPAVSTENIGFNGNLVFNSWLLSCYDYHGDGRTQRYTYEKVDVTSTKTDALYNLFDYTNVTLNRANLTGIYASYVNATAQWDTRVLVYSENLNTKRGDFTKVSRTGYDFMGWKSTSSVKSGVAGVMDDTIYNSSNPNYSIKPATNRLEDVLVAQWRAKKYRLILDYNKPVPSGDSATLGIVEFDKSYSNITDVTGGKIPSCSGYTFLGYYTDKEGGTKVTDSDGNFIDKDGNKITIRWNTPNGEVFYGHWTNQDAPINEDPKPRDPDVNPSTDPTDPTKPNPDTNRDNADKTNIANGNYYIPQSQIVRITEFDRTDKGIAVLCKHWWTWDYTMTCPGHLYNGEVLYCSSLDASGFVISNTSLNNYPAVVAAAGKWSDYSFLMDQENSAVDDDGKDRNVINNTPYDNPGEDPTDVPDVDSGTEDSTLKNNSGIVKTRYTYLVGLHRGNDRLTVAEWKNTDSLLTSLKNFTTGNTPQGRSKSNGVYLETIKISLVGDSSKALRRNSVLTEGVCSDGGGRVTKQSGSDLDITSNIAIDVYKGIQSTTPNGPLNNTNLNGNTNKSKINNITSAFGTGQFVGAPYSNRSVYSGERVNSGTVGQLKFNFYPYIQMRYDELSEDTLGQVTKTKLDKPIYILGDNQRRLEFNDYAEVISEDTNGYGSGYAGESDGQNEDEAYGFTLKLKSSQYLTDKVSSSFAVTDKVGNIVDNSNVLPGGATLTLTTSINIRQRLLLRTYQVALTDEGLAQVTATSTDAIHNPTFEEMKQDHLDFVNSIISGFDGVEITQWQYRSNSTDELKALATKWARGDFSTPGTEVYAGADLQGLYNSATPINASTDLKYYYRSNLRGETASMTDTNRADFDARWKNDVADKYDSTRYDFKVDVYGNILVRSPGDTEYRVALTQDQDERDLPANSILKVINDRTLIISKLRDALEYNTGKDDNYPWTEVKGTVDGKAVGVTDGNWYNEAFDGVSVYIFESEIETGLIGSNERTMVLDPKLNTVSTGIKDQLDKYALNQFRTSVKSNTYVTGDDTQIGEFRDNKFHMNELIKSYISKPFYTTNVTVQDKH